MIHIHNAYMKCVVPKIVQYSNCSIIYANIDSHFSFPIYGVFIKIVSLL